MEKDKLDKILGNNKHTIDLLNIISFEKFNEVIERTSDLLDFLGDNASQASIVNIVDGSTYILGGDFLIATSNTLKSISACCRIGCFADANMLIRKYRDDLFLYLYIIESSNNSRGLTNEEISEIIDGEMTEEKFIKVITLTLSIISSGIRKNRESIAIDAWFNNTVESNQYKRCIDISNYLRYLEKNELVKDCIEKYNLKDRWNNLGRKQNDYTHNNGRRFLADNSNPYYISKKSEVLLEQVYKDIATITSYFLTVLILIKPQYISSSTYADFLDIGIQPLDGSQYWVASIVQDYIDEFVVELHPKIKEYLRSNNPCSMEIL